MKTILQLHDDAGWVATFTGSDERGVFACRDILPLSVAWNLSRMRFGEVVMIDHPAGQWLKSATIISADSDAAGTVFELSFP